MGTALGCKLHPQDPLRVKTVSIFMIQMANRLCSSQRTCIYSVVINLELNKYDTFIHNKFCELHFTNIVRQQF